jgi:hypothetical protein
VASRTPRSLPHDPDPLRDRPLHLEHVAQPAAERL